MIRLREGSERTHPALNKMPVFGLCFHKAHWEREKEGGRRRGRKEGMEKERREESSPCPRKENIFTWCNVINTSSKNETNKNPREWCSNKTYVLVSLSKYKVQSTTHCFLKQNKSLRSTIASRGWIVLLPQVTHNSGDIMEHAGALRDSMACSHL